MKANHVPKYKRHTYEATQNVFYSIVNHANCRHLLLFNLNDNTGQIIDRMLVTIQPVSFMLKELERDILSQSDFIVFINTIIKERRKEKMVRVVIAP